MIGNCCCVEAGRGARVRSLAEFIVVLNCGSSAKRRERRAPTLNVSFPESTEMNININRELSEKVER